MKGHFIVHQDPKVLLCKAAVHTVNPPIAFVHRVIPLQGEDLHFPSLNFMRFFTAQISSISMFL